MRQRPWALIILAGLHFLAPIGNIVLNALVNKRNILEYFIFALSPDYLSKNGVIIIAPICAGFAIYACKKWSFFAYLVALATLFAFSYAGYVAKAGSVSLLPILLVYLINILVVSYFLLPAVRNIYFDRRMRWWEIQARYKCDFKCRWAISSQGNFVPGKIANISENGLFIKVDELPLDAEIVEVRIPFNNGVEAVFTGEAILHNKADTMGFGLKFKHSRESRKIAKQIVTDLEQKGLRLTNNKARPEDSFSYWLRTLLTTGKGFFLKKKD